MEDSHSFAMIPNLPILCLLSISPISLASKSTREQLLENLFEGNKYDYKKSPNGLTVVKMTMGVQHVYFPDDDSPVAVMICTAVYSWKDGRIIWNPDDYDGLNKLTLPSHHKLWKPTLMKNMDGKNHRLASTSHQLKGIEFHVTNADKAHITMYLRLEIEAQCESESAFPPTLKCTFHAVSDEDESMVDWVYIGSQDLLSGFMDNNATGTSLFKIDSVVGNNSKIVRHDRIYSDLTLTVKLRGSRSAHWVLSTTFLALLSLLILTTFLLPPSHRYLNSLVAILFFLLLIIPSQLIFNIKTYAGYGVPSQARVYGLLFVLSSLLLPLQHLFGWQSLVDRAPAILTFLQKAQFFKTLHSNIFPYTKDWTLPLVLVFIKSLLAFIFSILILATFII